MSQSAMIQLSPPSGWHRGSTGEVMMQADLVHPAANFASGMGACVSIVELFKHLLVPCNLLPPIFGA